MHKKRPIRVHRHLFLERHPDVSQRVIYQSLETVIRQLEVALSNSVVMAELRSLLVYTAGIGHMSDHEVIQHVAQKVVRGQAALYTQNPALPALEPLGDAVIFTIQHKGPTSPPVRQLFAPETARRLRLAFKELNDAGITPQINSAFRTPADQKYMQQGGSGSNPAAKCSWHEAGAAIDINGTHEGYYKTVIAVMKKNGFMWGGDYHSKKDPPHFDGRGFSGDLKKAFAKAQRYWDSTHQE
jgi:D-alanyl-D-alanine carboxypeptidase